MTHAALLRHGFLCGCLWLMPGGSLALAQEAPASAIEWLERALQAPQQPELAPGPPPEMPDLTPELDAAPAFPAPPPDEIAVTALSALRPDEAGLFAASVIGLPRDFWGPTPVAEIIPALEALPGDSLPSAARLGLRLLLAEFAAPVLSTPSESGALIRARVDKLIALGALEQAAQLIEAVPTLSAELRMRAFDIALLLGEEDRACVTMAGQITPSEGQAAQIFCMARAGNWQAAYTSLNVARRLGMVSATEAAILTRFLEEEEADFTPPPPQSITPLIWRLLEALGEPLPTSTLPVAYAHADLRGITGWRAQLDAAERLTRTQALQANQLFGLYTQRRAAASGGLWERVRAVQNLERALATRDPAVIGPALETAYALFAAVELESAFAGIHAEALADVALTGRAAQRLWSVLLLAQLQLERAAELAPPTALGAFVMALAQGAGLPATNVSEMAEAIRLGFSDTPPPDEMRAQIEAGALGMVALRALGLTALAAQGDLHAATQALQGLRALGLEAEARQIAVELMLLERRG